jgi:hypothetical protein
LELLKDFDPRLRRVWAIQHGADLGSAQALAGALAASSRSGLEILSRTVRTPDELERVLEGLRPGDALLVPDVAIMDLSAVLLETSLARRVPAVFSAELWVGHGGLVSYGADYRAQGVQAARLVGKILRRAVTRSPQLPAHHARRQPRDAASCLRVPRQASSARTSFDERRRCTAALPRMRRLILSLVGGAAAERSRHLIFSSGSGRLARVSASRRWRQRAASSSSSKGSSDR